MMKGNGSIRIGRKRKNGSDWQEIDLSLMEGDIALSTESVKSLKAVAVMGKRVVTVENLTSFHDYSAEDIDAGGFYILEHLKKETGIPFRSLYMDTKTLQRYRGDRKPLTENDRKRLLQLKEDLAERMQHEETEDYGDVISYMLDENCKLEQEAVHLWD